MHNKITAPDLRFAPAGELFVILMDMNKPDCLFHYHWSFAIIAALAAFSGCVFCLYGYDDFANSSRIMINDSVYLKGEAGFENAQAISKIIAASLSTVTGSLGVYFLFLGIRDCLKSFNPKLFKPR